MTKILSECPKEVIFVFDSYDIYSKPIKMIHFMYDDRTYEISLNEDEAQELGTKLIEIAAKRKNFEE